MASLTILFALLDLFNLSAPSTRLSRDIVFRVIAPFYEGGQKPITVIAFDDAYLRQMGTHWPMPYRTHTRFLETLYCYEPKAIFFDLGFTHQHSRDGQLDKFINYLKPDKATREKITNNCRRILEDETYSLPSLAKTYIADWAPQHHEVIPGGSAVLENFHKTDIPRLAINWLGDDGDYPLALPLADAGADLSYERLKTLWPGQHQGLVPSVALALYADLIPHEHVENLLAMQPDDMIVQWGYYPRKLQGEWTGNQPLGKATFQLRRVEKDCVDEPEGRLAPLGHALANLVTDLLGGLNSDHNPAWQPCPYSQWVPPEAVLNAIDDGERQTVRDLIAGRVVMIGAQIRGAPDLVQSPVHGQVPGVFLHAMALDNLLTFGPQRYWRERPAWSRGIEWVLLAFFVIASTRCNCRFRPRPLVAVGLVGVSVAITLVAVAVMAWHHVIPFNWIGVIALMISSEVVTNLIFPPTGDKFTAAANRSANAQPTET